MPLWKKLWLLFAVIWGVVAGLNVLTILAFAEALPRIESDSRARHVAAGFGAAMADLSAVLHFPFIAKAFAILRASIANFRARAAGRGV